MAKEEAYETYKKMKNYYYVYSSLKQEKSKRFFLLYYPLNNLLHVLQALTEKKVVKSNKNLYKNRFVFLSLKTQAGKAVINISISPLRC
jgi:hypothetical protein